MTVPEKVTPILFSPEMVRALLDGRKTQTRRAVTKMPERTLEHDRKWHAHVCPPSKNLPEWSWWDGPPHGPSLYHTAKCPYGKPGDLLYVREAYYQFGHWKPVPGLRTKTGRMKWRFVTDSHELRFDPPPVFRKGRHHLDPDTKAWHRRHGRFMPKVLTRLTLKITDVRVERVQDISEEDAKAEGPTQHPDWPEMYYTTWRAAFHPLWDSINEHRGFGWEANPWVWALSFEAIKANVDDVLREMAA